MKRYTFLSLRFYTYKKNEGSKESGTKALHIKRFSVSIFPGLNFKILL